MTKTKTPPAPEPVKASKTILWNRTAQEVVLSSGQALVFASGEDADAWLDRNALKQAPGVSTPPLSGVTETVYDKVSVV